MNNPVIDKAGNKRWWNSKYQLHRINGPAVEYDDGTSAWYKNGRLHRLNGPAVEKIGSKLVGWYIDGIPYDKEQYLKEVEKYISKKKLFILRLKYE